MPPTVLFIADHDDPDVPELSARLTRVGCDVDWLRLGLCADVVDVRLDAQGARLVVEGQPFSDELVAAVHVVVYRRWRVSPPRPFVHHHLREDPADFGQREWEAAVRHVLWRWQSSLVGPRWSRGVDWALGRLALLDLAARAGLSVPPYAAATLHDGGLDGPIVAKAIADNEEVDDGRYHPTSELDAPTVAALSTARSTCPTLLQARVAARSELRIAYSFGVIGAVRQVRPAGEPVDIRYAASVQRRSAPVPSELVDGLHGLARLAQLEMFMADVLEDADGALWVVDVTPDGTIGSSDDDVSTLMNAAAAGVTAAGPPSTSST